MTIRLLEQRSDGILRVETILNQVYDDKILRQMVEGRIVDKLAEEWIAQHGDELRAALRDAASLAMASAAKAICEAVERLATK
jgi:hypothetical protein